MVIDEDEQMGGDVVELRPGIDLKDEQRMLVTAHDAAGRRCYHRLRFKLDTDARKVYCRDCGVEVTAFTALHELARDVERFIARRQEAQRRARVAEQNLEQLEREERNAKARVRTAAKRLPVCECKPDGPPRWYPGRWCSLCGGVRKARP